jgi:hypothetical protein
VINAPKCRHAGLRRPIARLRWFHGSVVLAAVLSPPRSVAAHGFGDRYDLPVPLSLCAGGAAIAVVLSFVVIGRSLRSPAIGGYQAAEKADDDSTVVLHAARRRRQGRSEGRVTGVIRHQSLARASLHCACRDVSRPLMRSGP